jgi:2-oxoisovalerate dehydrogenase E2 component (dihydrolipoyl transacylase)
VLATPAVRRIAMENNVDLSLVQASGKDGRITKHDILNFVASGGRSNRVETAKEVVAATEASKAGSSKTLATDYASPVPVPKGFAGEDKEVQIRGIQKIMVKTMTAATSVPHFGYSDEIHIDRLMEARYAIELAML